MTTDAKILQVKRQHEESLLSLPNVVGVGRGFKVRKGERTAEVGLVVLVRDKVPPAGLEAEDMVPGSLEDIVTDVIEVGDLRIHDSRTARLRPAPPGVSLGHFKITAATFGAVVRHRTTGERLILSNNHVLANSNDAEPGDPVLQPGAADGGRLAADTLAELFSFVPIQFSVEPPDCGIAQGAATAANAMARLVGSRHRLQAYKVNPAAMNVVDAAVARPLRDEDVLDEILDIGAVSGSLSAGLGMAVRKSGRTTGFSLGQVIVLEATVTIGYGPSRRARFESQIVTSAMSEPGDSGSLLVAVEEAKAVGLLFAGSTQATIHNPIQAVLDGLEVEI